MGIVNNRTLIVILTWNRLNVTKDTLKTLFHHNGKDIDLLFIDNGSTDGTVEYLEGKGFEVIKNKTNKGIFRASTKAWEEGVRKGYDYILNLQNDFPCVRPMPFKDLEVYMDNNKDVGFIRLNKKKDKKKNIVTGQPITYEKAEIIGSYTLSKNNYHAGFNPALIRSTIICDFIKYDGDNPRERILMNNFKEIGLKCSKLMPEVFDTLKQNHRVEGWKH
jgi:glycosyltransferase involved in cell wall biosynthesis